MLLVAILLAKYIRFPNSDGLREVVDGFKHKFGFPQCAGVVDGTHVPIVSPVEYPADHYNCKGFHSIIMQGTVNNLGQFIDVYIGWPGHVHDTRAFSNLTLYRKGQANELLPNWTESLGGEEVPLVILGGPVYPLLPWVMKAFLGNGRLYSQQMFNFQLSRARVVVEHSYGHLKGRWRWLLKRLDINVSDVPKLVAACFTLHNICEIHGDTFDEEWLEGVEAVGETDVIETSTQSVRRGEHSTST